MFNKAGSDTISENNKVLMPFADFTNLSILPIRKTRTTRINVGDTGMLLSILSTAQTTKYRIKNGNDFKLFNY